MTDSYHKVGRTLKSFGTNGELRIQIFDDCEYVFTPSAFIFLEIDGLYVPFQIEQVANHAKPLIKLRDIDYLQQANQLDGRFIFITNSQQDEDRLLDKEDGLDDLTGYEVIFTGLGVQGTLNEIREFPGQQMAFVTIPSMDQREIMVPLVASFIEHIDSQHRKIYLILPEGFGDL